MDKKNIDDLTKKLQDTFTTGDDAIQEKTVKKFVKFYINETTDEEKEYITKLILKETAYSKLVKDYLEVDSLATTYYRMVGSMLLVGTLLIFVTALFFSDHFIVAWLNSFLQNLLYAIGIGTKGA